MFVGCVVAGSVMLVGSGAAVRGALIRDVSAYAIAASAVALMLHSGQVIMKSISFAHAIAVSAPFLGHHWASCAAPVDVLCTSNDHVINANCVAQA